MQLKEIAKHINGDLVGDSIDVKGIDTLEDAKEGSLSFLLESSFLPKGLISKASAFISFGDLEKISKPYIKVKDPRKAMAEVILLYNPPQDVIHSISPQASVSRQASISEPVTIGAFSSIGDHTCIGEHTHIYPQVTIGNNCTIGKHCILYPNTVLYDGIEIGDHVIINAGCVIGADGFGYYQENSQWIKIPHVGHVVIKDWVELGANTCIDRGCLGNTFIGEGTKIDNVTQVGHNCHIGNHSALAAFVGLSGSTTLGDHVSVGGQAGFSGHLEVGSHTTIAAKSGVTKSVPSKRVFSGFPAQDHKEELKYQARLKRLAKKTD
ncbi:MAG: UDP-3-O-(3-hydroxymyristoyl)glucosamine N-acyltransferase [Candidatus Margulisbacteria bacterium]|nr:UDP-3-O-(3-hydroxymyristoyl)glucosamine N-acyltransferase [Candidatus Margulisiibacteriota bacterium]